MLSAIDLHHTYAPGATPVLRGVNVAIAQGDFACIMGRSGSGKSTLLYALSTLLRPTSGQVLYQGRDVFGLSERQRNALRGSDLAMIFQMHHLLPALSALENVLTPFLARLRPVGAKAVARGMECLSRVGLADKARRLPGNLSGGEQQRVAIARALACSPKALFADEPTGSLDSGTGDKIMDLLLELNAEGLTVVMVTHQPDYAALANRVITIADGRVAQAS
ncbi:MAG: ABC transporter ATP-binding protein [Desulfovibrionaceae bacterium]|nr:ABC transporter ATP-binding protein [Desulfovibrionaceae bacterium]